jgi:hypothetical protein
MSSRDLREMSRRFYVQVALAVVISTSVDGQVAGPGCADGSREGFVDTVTFTKIAACGGTTMGVDVTSIAASTQFCADGCVCVCLSVCVHVAHCMISPTLHELYLSHNWGGCQSTNHSCPPWHPRRTLPSLPSIVFPCSDNCMPRGVLCTVGVDGGRRNPDFKSVLIFCTTHARAHTLCTPKQVYWMVVCRAMVAVGGALVRTAC